MLEARAYPGQWIAHQRQLLPFGKRSRHVINRDFHRRVAAARQFPSQFPVEIEAVTLERQTGEAFAPEHLEHRERVSKALAVHEVEERGKQHMSQVHPMTEQNL